MTAGFCLFFDAMIGWYMPKPCETRRDYRTQRPRRQPSHRRHPLLLRGLYDGKMILEDIHSTFC